MSLKFEKSFSIQQPPGDGGGGEQEINNQDLTITENGVYTAESGYTGIGTATVNVQPSLGAKSITANDTYVAANEGLDGYSSVTVNVPTPQPTLIAKTITENGTYNASQDNADGYSSVTANIPRGGVQTSVVIAPSFTATLGSITTTAEVQEGE